MKLSEAKPVGSRVWAWEKPVTSKGFNSAINGTITDFYKSCNGLPGKMTVTS